MATDATIDEVLEAVKTAVAGLALTFNTAVVPVAKRKLPAKEEAIDPATQIIISLAEALPLPRRFAQAVLLFTLPVEITLITPNRGDLVATVPDLGSFYGQIRAHFAKTYTVKGSFPITLPANPSRTASLFAVKPAAGTFLDRPKLAAQYDYSQQVVNVSLLDLTRA
jgi:hypothetical protein